ncbi:MAG: DUF362 domain-containing protein [Bacteroidota bacterium]
MKRRNFIKKGVILGTTAGIGIHSLSASPVSLLMSEKASKGNYDLVAVRGENIVAMFEKAMQEMGGISQWVKPGQTVVVKPNIGWDVTAERAANTNPELIGAIVKQCIDAGARRVNVFDHTCDNWEKCYVNSGIREAVESAGGRMIPGNFEQNYRTVAIPRAQRLKEAKVHEQIIESDVFINVPVLKHHGSTQLTIAMKNLMGIVYDRRFWHRNDLHQCIADFCLYRMPDLNIVDAMLVMTQNGPRGTAESDLVRKNSLIVSSDIVAADAASAMIFGSKPEDIGYLSIAQKMGLGSLDLSSRNIKRLYI